MSEENENQEQEIQENEREPLEVTITDIELEKLKEEAAEFRHKYLHLLADVENSRKRMLKDQGEIIQYAIRNLILDFLHPIDHFDKALQFTDQASQEVKHWATGFKMILGQFKDVLSNHGVKPIEAKGKQFDPHIHEAVEMVDTDNVPPGIVMEENSKGYLIGDKTLRPSRVKVSKAIGTESDRAGAESIEELNEDNF